MDTFLTPRLYFSFLKQHNQIRNNWIKEKKKLGFPKVGFDKTIFLSSLIKGIATRIS